MQVPAVVRRFYSYFPLYSYEEETVKSAPAHPTLWVAPPVTSPRLSGDIECLKWQTYLALRNVSAIRLRYDIRPDGGVGGVLPSLHLPNGDLLSAARIPGWADTALNAPLDELEGYASPKLRDESRAWISLFESVVHSTLVSPENSRAQVSLCRINYALLPSWSRNPKLPVYFYGWIRRMTGRRPIILSLHSSNLL